MTNEVLLAIPLFIFMGVMLERSRIAEDLLETMTKLFGSLRGGLGISVVLVGALLAASTGIVGATAATMGLIVLPAMLRHGYDPRLAAGIVAAAATLAQIIPPVDGAGACSAITLNNGYQAAQLSKGIFAPQAVTVSDLFAGALLPGLLLVALYIAYVVAWRCWRRRRRPALQPDPQSPHGARLAGSLFGAFLAPLALVLAVLGSILGGIATPTEAAVGRRRRRDPARGVARGGPIVVRAGRDRDEDRADDQHDLRYSDRRDHVRARVPRLWWRRSGASCAQRSAGRHRGRDPRGHGWRCSCSAS